MKGSTEVADIFRAFGPAYRQAYGAQMPLRQLRAMRAIEVCRTAELGGHVEACDACGMVRINYNSCRNRHCPKCQCLAKERWLEDRKRDVLPVPYFHVVFTLPEELRPLALRNQKVVYNALFKAASETLLALAADAKHLGAQIGFTAILHTWTQTLLDHPHLHCIVPAGGLSADGKQWVAAKERYFLPVRVLSALFRGKFLPCLRTAYKQKRLVFPGEIAPWEATAGFHKLVAQLHQKEWHVYCEPPFGSPENVLSYLGRYTHRVAISNHRRSDMAFTLPSGNDYRIITRLAPNKAEGYFMAPSLARLPNGALVAAAPHGLPYPDGGKSLRSLRFFRSTDGGSTWNPVCELPHDSCEPNLLAHDGRLYLISADFLF